MSIIMILKTMIINIVYTLNLLKVLYRDSKEEPFRQRSFYGSEEPFEAHF